MWRARKISAIDCPNLWLLFPLGKAWKTSRWMKSPPSFTCKFGMKLFKLSPSFKGLVMPTRGVWVPTSSFQKVLLMVLAINSKPHLMTNLEIKFKWLYESIYVGFWRDKIPHKCSHIMGWTINPFILQTLIFHPGLQNFIRWIFFQITRVVS